MKTTPSQKNLALAAALALLALFAIGLRAQEEDPFASDEEDPFGSAEADPFASDEEDPLRDLERQIAVTVEWIEVPHETYTALTEGDRRSANYGEVRKTLGALARKGEAKIVETASLVTRSGQRAKTESVREFVYPTAFALLEPSEKSAEKAEKAEKKKAPEDSPSGVVAPTAFEIRNVGCTLEVDPVVGADGRTIDLNLAPEIVYHVGDVEWGISKVGESETPYRQPIFYTVKTTTAVSVTDAEYLLIGIQSPHDEEGNPDYARKLLVFVRAQLLLVGAPADLK